MLASNNEAMSLKWRVALVISILVILPNIVIWALLLPSWKAIGISFLLPLVGWFGLSIVIAVLIGYWLSQQLLLPLSKLTNQVHLLRAKSDELHSAKLDITDAPQEVLAFSNAFNDLLQRISTEQSRRNAFVATLMHDLKTPLVATNNVLAIVRDKDDLNKANRLQIINQIIDENERLISLVQKLVVAHKFDREGVELRKESINLATLINRVVANLKTVSDQNNLNISVKGNATAEVDSQELARALYNLIGNGMRYAKSEIEITIFKGLIRIRDDGPGLPAPIEKLAQPFNHQPITIAGKSYTAGTGGLGLFIARRIIEAHGGRLTSEETGFEGTVLLVYLDKASKKQYQPNNASHLIAAHIQTAA